MASERPVRFQYDAEVALREVEQLRAVEELAFRRVLDLIVVYRNRLIDDDVELARMTKCGESWPQIKARLINDHGLLYVLDGFIRNVRCDEALIAVERSTNQKRTAGRASAAARQAKKDTALPQPPSPTDTAPRQPLPDPPTTDVAPPCPEPPAPEPAPIVVEPVPMSGNGASDDSTEPEREGTTIPANWGPTPEGVTFALNRGFAEKQIEPLTREFVTRNTVEGIVSKDWDATWRLSVLRAGYSSPRPAVGQPMRTAL